MLFNPLSVNADPSSMEVYGQTGRVSEVILWLTGQTRSDAD